MILYSVALFLILPHAQAQSFSSGTVAGLEEADRLYWRRDVEDNLERATARLEEVASRNPDDAQALWRLGRALVRRGEREKNRKEKLKLFYRAQELIKRSIKNDPAFAESHFWLGLAMGRTGETRGILKSLFLVGPIRREMRRTLELDPRHGGAHHVLGEMLRQIPGFAGGSKRGAVKELETAVALGPNYTAHYPALAQAYLDYGKPEEAKAALRKIFDVKEPDDPGEYQENLQEARSMLEKLERKK